MLHRDGFPLTGAYQIPPEWTDDNHHMNEAFYLVVASGATNCFLDMIGAGPGHVASGMSFFTVETHIRYLVEVHVTDNLVITTQVLAGEGKRLHLFHRLWRGEDLTATVEMLLLHTDLNTRRTCFPPLRVIDLLASCIKTQPMRSAEGAGRFVGQAIERPESCTDRPDTTDSTP